MTQPADDLVEVEVAPEQVRPGDYLLTAADEATGPPDEAHSTVDHVAIPTKVGGGYALIRRGELTRVRRPRSATTLAPTTAAPVAPEQLDAVRDLALALAEQASAQGVNGKRVRDAADRVRKVRP